MKRALCLYFRTFSYISMDISSKNALFIAVALDSQYCGTNETTNLRVEVWRKITPLNQ